MGFEHTANNGSDGDVSACLGCDGLGSTIRGADERACRECEGSGLRRTGALRARASSAIVRDLAYWRAEVARRASLVDEGRASLARLGPDADTEIGAAAATELGDALQQLEDAVAIATQAVRSHERELRAVTT